MGCICRSRQGEAAVQLTRDGLAQEGEGAHMSSVQFSVTAAPHSHHPQPSGDAMVLWPTKGPGTQPELTQSQPLNITGSMATDFVIFFWFLNADCKLLSHVFCKCSEVL